MLSNVEYGEIVIFDSSLLFCGEYNNCKHWKPSNNKFIVFFYLNSLEQWCCLNSQNGSSFS